MDSHLYASLLQCRKYTFQEVLEIIPKHILCNRSICLKKLIQLSHSLRLPAWECHVVLLCEVQNILCHGLIIIFDLIFLIEESCRAVSYRVEKICSCPVEYWHEVITDDFYTILSKVSDTCLIVLDQSVPGIETDLDVVMYVYRFNDFSIKAIGMNLVHYLFDFFLFPDFSRHFVMKCPNNTCHSRNLLDVSEAYRVVAFTIPSPSHFHWHIYSPL